MSTRTYGQYCGMARALDLLGERWALMIVRDLLVAPQRFTDLRRELHGIPSNVLTTRLKDLESGGVVRRRVLPRPESGVVYELTEEGRDLEDVVLALGRWGSRRLAELHDGDVVTTSSMAMAMRTTFQAQAADGVDATFELRLGEIVLSLQVRDGELDVQPGEVEQPDARIVAGPELRRLMAGEVDVAEAIAASIVAVEGDLALLGLFARLFRIGARPERVAV